MRTMLTIAAAALACTAAVSAHAQERRGDGYRALGTEPFWSVTIETRTMRFDAPGRRPVTVAKPRPIIGINGTRYETPQITVDITHIPCNDGMSDRRYPDTVTVRTGRTHWRGCGGTPRAGHDRSAIIDGTWRVEAIDGRPLRGPEATLRFEQGRVTGTGGCNRLSGSFRFDGGRLNIGRLNQTRMACPGPAMRQEAAIVEILGQSLSVTTNRAEKLVMTARDGRRIVLAPEAPAPRPRR